MNESAPVVFVYDMHRMKVRNLLNSADGRAKVSAAMAAPIRSKLTEQSYLRQVVRLL